MPEMMWLPKCLASFPCCLFVGYITRNPVLGICSVVGVQNVHFERKGLRPRATPHQPRLQGSLGTWENDKVPSHPRSLSGIGVVGKPRLCQDDTNHVAVILATSFHSTL